MFLSDKKTKIGRSDGFIGGNNILLNSEFEASKAINFTLNYLKLSKAI